MNGILLTAALVLRLQFRQLPFDPGLILLTWLQRPAIEITLAQLSRTAERPNRQLAFMIDKVYPF
jgi:hypothetical protein